MAAKASQRRRRQKLANLRRRLDLWPGNAASWHSRKRSALGAVLVMTSPGVPLIFQGQEFLEDRWFHDDDPIEWWRRDAYAGNVQ